MKKIEIIQRYLNAVNALLAQKDVPQEVKRHASSDIEKVLFEEKLYAGFNYTYWLDRGYSEWIEAGKPDDNRKYLGAEYDRFYYFDKVANKLNKEMGREINEMG